MNPFDTWLARFDPNQVGLSAFFILFTGSILLFIWRKAWPWYVTIYWPTKIDMQKREAENRFIIEREQNQVLMSIRDAMIEIKTVTAQLVSNFAEHDNLMSNFIVSRSDHDTLLNKRLDALDHAIYDTKPVKTVKTPGKIGRPKKQAV